MKQTISIVLMLAMLLLFCSACAKQTTDTELLAQVKGVGITKQQVADRVLYNQIRNEAYANTPLADGLNVLDAVTEEEALQELVACEVIRWQLLQSGYLIPRETANKNFDEEYALLKTDKSQATFYEKLKKALTNHQISEEEYIQLSYDFSYDYYNMVYAKHMFFQSGSATEESFQAHIEDLVKQANVQYIK